MENKPGPQVMAAPAPQATGSAWVSDFWDFFNPLETCLFATYIPCILFGKTAARIKDPTLKDYSPINGKCMAFACCPSMFLRRERGNFRNQYGIEGSTIGDCGATWCCPCCTLIQLDKESVQRCVPPAGYQPTQGMTYQQ